MVDEIDLAGSIQPLETADVAKKLKGTAAEGVSTKLRLLRDRTIAEIIAASNDDAPYSSMASAWFKRFKAQFQPRLPVSDAVPPAS